MATLQMGDTTFEKGDTETEKAPYFRGFGGYPELFKSCFPHQRIAQSAIRFFVCTAPKNGRFWVMFKLIPHLMLRPQIPLSRGA